MQCFKVKSHEIVKRFDPYYYMPEFKNLNNKLLKLDNVVSIGSIIKSWNRGDGPREGFYTEDSTNGIYFIRVNNLKNHTIVLDDIKYINKHIHETKLKRAQVTSGDVVFAISGTKDNLGTVSIIPENIKEANLNSALVKINLDERKILKEYFCYFFDLPIARMQIVFIGKGAAQNNLNNEEISEILIPLPSMERQKDVINLMKQAYLNKFTKEQEAEEILNSIEKYILEKLGILLPEIKDKKIYMVNAKDIKDKRIDPYYFQPKFENTINMIKKSKYGSTYLNNVINEFGIAKGFSPSDSEKDGGSKVLQIKNIDTYGNIDTSYWQSSIKDIYCKTKPIQKNDIIVVVTGATIGKVAIWNKENEDFYLGGDMIKFQVSDNYNPLYVLSFLLTQLGQLQILRNITGATNGHLSPNDVKNIVICDAPQAIQDEIATEYYNNMLQAEKLKREAKVEFEKAKAEVEKMILGEK